MTKYGATKVTIDGIVFDSKAEAKRFEELRLMQLAGAIRNLQVHMRYPIDVLDVRICVYVDDFSYDRVVENVIVEHVVEDVKGVRTPVYVIKRRLMQAVYGIHVQEVMA
jgi:hypothetical protein